MNKKELIREMEKQWAKDNEERRKEIESNPLSQYSTTKLKRELRRRKRQ